MVFITYDEIKNMTVITKGQNFVIRMSQSRGVVTCMNLGIQQSPRSATCWLCDPR